MSFTVFNKPVNEFILKNRGVSLFVKREDRIHPQVPGNKYRKLKYNLAFAKEKGYSTLLTFGGAYSNHIAAVAAAAKHEGFKAVGIIRGEELESYFKENPTLYFAHKQGMQFKFVSRETYRKKEAIPFLQELSQEYDGAYCIPEGGTNTLAIKGCTEILTEADHSFDVICCSAGTGGTAAGIIKSLHPHQRALIFSALKGSFLEEAIQQWVDPALSWELNTTYHFGGYAKYDVALINFINAFAKAYNTPLDPIYTGKMMYGITELIRQGYFPPKTRILAIHTGGIQGIAGMNKKLQKKGLPLIE